MPVRGETLLAVIRNINPIYNKTNKREQREKKERKENKTN